tara:strand:+ start:301 stop:1320 length:1020 start_codon:yes stop_codon:yes gene_type:complete
MSEGYIGLAPSYGVFQKQVIAGTTATIYDLDFDVAQATQLMVSIDGIVQEPDYAFSIGRGSTGKMQIVFAEALTVSSTTGNTTSGSNSLTNVNTANINVGQGISGTGIDTDTHVQTIATTGDAGVITLSKNALSTQTGTTVSTGARIFVIYLGKQLLTPSTTDDHTVPLVEHFSGNNSTTLFSLARTPPNQSSILVFVDGVFQRGSGNAYTLAGASISFTGTPPTGTNNITVHYVATQNNSVPTVTNGSITNLSLNLDYNESTHRSPTVVTTTAGQTTQAIKRPNITAFYDVNSTLVLLNGIMLIPTTDYTISSTTLTLAGGAAATGSSLVVRYLPTTA